jgi:hypothetical protein
MADTEKLETLPYDSEYRTDPRLTFILHSVRVIAVVSSESF